jgi:uncharacterized protein
MEILGAADCVGLLHQMPIGRIAITVDGLPVILPVNFRFFEGAIVFPAARGTKLARATVNAVVAFAVDSYEANGKVGWSVLVQGVASEVTDPAELEVARALQFEPWGGGDETDSMVRIETRTLSGRRFTFHPHVIAGTQEAG